LRCSGRLSDDQEGYDIGFEIEVALEDEQNGVDTVTVHPMERYP
jgi:hypothetical protein